MPFPWSIPGKYESIRYTFDHLCDFSRNLRDSSGVSRSVVFRFSYHCFTDSSKKQNDFRHPYDDPAFPHEHGTRVFCPKRWLLSRDLVKWLKEDMSGVKVDRIDGKKPSYVWNRILPGMDKPYCVFFEFDEAKVGCALGIKVTTAYVRGGGRMAGETDRFIAVLKGICGDDGALAPKTKSIPV